MKIYPQSPEKELLIMNPTEGRKLDIYQSEIDLNLYLSRQEFIKASDDYKEITLQLENDCEHEALLAGNSLKKKLGNPGKVKIFLKNKNLFLKKID